MVEQTIPKNDKKLINAWCMYDWANSVYSLTITTAVFPEYFLGVTSNKANNNVVDFFGWQLQNSVLYSYALSAVFLIAALFSPFLSSIADYTGRKKMFMRFFCYLGSLSCVYLFYFTSDNIPLSVIAFVLAGIGYSGSIVFYNSFLPEITTDEYTDKVSAKGFAFGYAGSVILLLFNIVMLLQPQLFGLGNDKGMAARISFLSVGVWWFGFSHYTFHYLPTRTSTKESAGGNWLLNGFLELKKVVAELSWQKFLRRFLFGFFFYNMGVQTVMYMATIFGKDQLHLETASLIIVILLIQVIAIVGANVFAKISQLKGNIKALTYLVFIWIFVCVAAYFVQTGNQFYALAVVVGFVMGGVQSLSRSTYAKLIPQDSSDHASYFSFYDVTDKVSTFLGTFVFGFITQITGGMRNSAIALTIFFVLSLVFLFRIPSKQSYGIRKGN